MKKVILTGARGFVAGGIISQAPKDWELHVLSREKEGSAGPGVVWHGCGLLDGSAIKDLFQSLKPTAVIHAAAIGDIDYCQAHREEALQVNTEATANLARLCEGYDARMVYVSTDNVFDGEGGPYIENDATEPVNFYGRTKLDGELRVQDLAVDYAIARLSLVMGMPLLFPGNSFLSRMIPRLEEGKPIGVPDTEIRSPIDVFTLGRALIELADNTFTGTIHLAGNDILNRIEMVQRIATAFGFSPGLIQPTDPTAIPGRADRPRDASLRNSLAKMILQTPMLGFDEGLQRIREDWHSQRRE